MESFAAFGEFSDIAVECDGRTAFGWNNPSGDGRDVDVDRL
jgi:hypothetical protein